MPRKELITYKDDVVVPKSQIRTAALIGTGGYKKLSESKVAVIGLGGVGSWTAEFLARTGIGEIVIFDFDKVEESNINRQLQAFPDAIGLQKAKLLFERLNKLSEKQKIKYYHDFIDENYLENLGENFDVIVDAIDNMTAKASIINWARKKNIKIISSLGAASHLDPSMVKCSDLAFTTVCPMGRELRKILRVKYDFEKEGKMNVTAVFSTEKPWKSSEINIKNGSLVFVTSAFASMLTFCVVKHLSLPLENFQE